MSEQARAEDEWTGKLIGRDQRALARAITLIEAGDELGQRLLARLRGRAGQGRVVGVTGPPGSGKSTLVDRLVGSARERGERVAVVAVDPSSPFTRGAILGDRIRMTRWHSDDDVFIRSMAARGHLGGLAAATLQVVALLDAVGFETIFLETVGVGQSEVEIVEVADSTVLVLTPGQGDSVQAFKAGIMEIADLFVVNKADQPGAARLVRELRAMLDIGGHAEGAWGPPILETTASQGAGVEELMEAIDAHARYLQESGRSADRRRRRARFEISAELEQELSRALAGRADELVDEVLAGRLTPAQAVARLLER